jgi:predicted MFS family arabinose efflux permease
MSVSWILSYGLFAHLEKDKWKLRMISSLYLFYIAALILLFAFETHVRYIQLMYFMLLFSNLGGLFMMRALQKSVQQYAPSDVHSNLRRVYAILTMSYTVAILVGFNRYGGIGTRCDDAIVYPYCFLLLMVQQLLQTGLMYFAGFKDFWIPLRNLEQLE